jgi:hypothetical protein
LVCHQWKDVITQVPVSVDLRNLKPGYKWKLYSLFLINNIDIQWSKKEQQTQILEIVQNCKNLSEIYNYGQEDVAEVLCHVPNPLLLKSIKVHSMENLPFDKLVNINDLT